MPFVVTVSMIAECLRTDSKILGGKNVHSIKVVLQLSTYMHVVGPRFYNMIVHILLILKTITSMLNRLAAVQVQSYVHAYIT